MSPPQIQIRIINTRFPRFVIVSRYGFHWTGEGWSRHLRKALLYADANVLRSDIERLKITNEYYHRTRACDTAMTTVAAAQAM
jgi:hypothetical protein